MKKPSSSSALSRRKGETGLSRRIPWEYIICVAVTVFLVFSLLYMKTVNSFVQHQEKKNGIAVENPQIQQRQQPEDQPEVMVLTTALGKIKIKLRGDLSQESIDYIHDILKNGECPRCTFYRAEEHAILQGMIKSPQLKPEVLIPKGNCPKDLQDSKWKDDCHGPIMGHGMVGWAGGKTGPDFFIDWYKEPAKFWGAQHTVWGEVMLEDEESVGVIEQIWKLPVKKQGLTYLVEPIKFKMELV